MNITYSDVSKLERFKALLIDSIVLTFIAGLLPYLIDVVFGFYFIENMEFFKNLSSFMYILKYLFVIFYTVFYPYFFGSSFGKSKFDLKLVDSNNQKASIIQYFIRVSVIYPYFFLFSPFIYFNYEAIGLDKFITFSYIGYGFLLVHIFLIFIRSDHMSLADWIAGTKLVKNVNYEIESIGEKSITDDL